MRLALANEKIIGKELARPIYSSAGIMYMNVGITITERILNNIKKIGLNTLYIKDNNSQLVLEEIIESSIYLKLLKDIKSEFLSIKKNNKFNDKKIKDTIKDLIENINISENAYMYNTIETKDEIDILVKHSLDVSIVALSFGLKQNLSEDKLINLGIGAILHDVGKLLETNNDHATSGYNFLKSHHSIMPTSLVCVFQHHEKSDGTGYPNNLIDSEIYEFAKIVSVCDEYINLISARQKLPYEAIEEISAKSTTAFNRDIVDFFVKSTICYPNGLSIMLNNGDKGTIIRQNKNFPQRPVIKLENSSKEMNLLEELTLFINKADI